MADCKFRVGDQVAHGLGVGTVAGVRSVQTGAGEVFEVDVEHDRYGGHSWVAEGDLVSAAMVVAKPAKAAKAHDKDGDK